MPKSWNQICSNATLRNSLVLAEKLRAKQRLLHPERTDAWEAGLKRRPGKIEEWVVRRLLKKVKFDFQTGCWNWTGGTCCGYGIMTIAKNCFRSHRVSYTLFVGDIPDGLVTDHLCMNKRCVNPTHLEPVTNRVNMLRAHAVRKHCKRGHLLVKGPRPSDVSRRCITCRRNFDRAHARAQRQQKKMNRLAFRLSQQPCPQL